MSGELTRSHSLPDIAKIRRQLAAASDPMMVRQVEAALDGVETYMEKSGIYDKNKIRPYVEEKMRARWKLGLLLSRMERGKAPGKGKMLSQPGTSFRVYLKQLGLDKNRAQDAQRIACMPEKKLEQTISEHRSNGQLLRYDDLIRVSKEFWYKESRRARHKKISAKASFKQSGEVSGPFPIIYADPPWDWEVFSEKGSGLGRTALQHYPTLTDDEICKFKINGRSIEEIAHRDAALFLWCTSSNLLRAFKVITSWGFEYKTHAIWHKKRIGMGRIFRNKHELLLYATRGVMPGPHFVPYSVFEFDRPKGFSSKPPEVRQMIEKMYPDLKASDRIELFARGKIDRWTSHGLEAL
jgi:N6-adenosine-specific RNA methylase IME4